MGRSPSCTNATSELSEGFQVASYGEGCQILSDAQGQVVGTEGLRVNRLRCLEGARASGGHCDSLTAHCSADGHRATEAAIVMLTNACVLPELSAAIVLDLDRNLAWIDWPTLQNQAGHASADTRAVLLLAAAIAAHGPDLQPDDQWALRLAADHLATQRAHKAMRRRP